MTEEQKPTFPQTHLNVTPQGLIVSIQLGPATAITQVVDKQAMIEVVKMWKETIKQEQGMIQFAQHVSATKNRG